MPRKLGGGGLGAASRSFSLLGTTAPVFGTACSLGTTGPFSIGDVVDGKLSLDPFECDIVDKLLIEGGRTKTKG